MNEAVSIANSPRRIRQNNIVAALQAIYSQGHMSRAELARKLGLNRSSSGEIVAELTRSGLVRESEESERPDNNRDNNRENNRAGRPGIMLELVADAAYFIGIEIGVEHISVVLLDLDAKLRFSTTIGFDTPNEAVEVAVQKSIELILGLMPTEMIAKCKGLGLATPAHIRADGSVSLAPLIGWQDIALKDIVEKFLPLTMPVLIENDANAFAIGDSYRNGNAGVTLALLMETGIGGGIMIDGKLFHGGHGLAGEIGHIHIPLRDGVAGSGKNFEQLIGREAILSQYRKVTGVNDKSLQDLLTDVRDRVPAAINVAESWSRYLAYALVQVCRLIDPARIVLGGSVAMLYPMMAARVATYMGEGQSISFPHADIIVDEDAALGAAFGAACLMHQRFISLENEAFST